MEVSIRPGGLAPSSVFLLHKNEAHSIGLSPPLCPRPALVFSPFLSLTGPTASPASGPLPLLLPFPPAFLSDLPGVGSSFIIRTQLTVTSSEGPSFLDPSPHTVLQAPSLTTFLCFPQSHLKLFR